MHSACAVLCATVLFVINSRPSVRDSPSEIGTVTRYRGIHERHHRGAADPYAPPEVSTVPGHCALRDEHHPPVRLEASALGDIHAIVGKAAAGDTDGATGREEPTTLVLGDGGLDEVHGPPVIVEPASSGDIATNMILSDRGPDEVYGSPVIVEPGSKEVRPPPLSPPPRMVTSVRRRCPLAATCTRRKTGALAARSRMVVSAPSPLIVRGLVIDGSPLGPSGVVLSTSVRV